MKKLVTITADDLLKMLNLQENEMKAQSAKERAAYLKMLRELCPSKEMRTEAKRRSKRDDSCDTCIYCTGESPFCWSDTYMDDLNTDPCYEGVLRFLVKEAEEESRGIEKLNAELEQLLLESPKNFIQAVIGNYKTMRILTKWIVAAADENWKLPPDTAEAVRELNNLLDELFVPANCNSDGGGKNERK